MSVIRKRKFAKKASKKSGIKPRSRNKTSRGESSSSGYSTRNEDWDAIRDHQKKQDYQEFSEKYHSRDYDNKGPYNEDAEIMREHQMKEDAQNLADKYYVDPYANERR